MSEHPSDNESSISWTDPDESDMMLEDFIFALHSTIAQAGGKVKLTELGEKYKQIQGQEFRVEKFLYVANQRVDLALKRIPHIVRIKEEADKELFVVISQEPHITKEELLNIDKKYREKAAQLRAMKQRIPLEQQAAQHQAAQAFAQVSLNALNTSNPNLNKLKNETNTPAQVNAARAAFTQASVQQQVAALTGSLGSTVSSAKRPPPPPPNLPTPGARNQVQDNNSAAKRLRTEESKSPPKSPLKKDDNSQSNLSHTSPNSSKQPVVIHALLRLLEQKGPISLHQLDDIFQSRWKCPFNASTLGLISNKDIEKYFRESTQFKLKHGPGGPILCLASPPPLKDVPNVLEEITGLRQNLAVLDLRLEELVSSLSRAAVQKDQSV